MNLLKILKENKSNSKSKESKKSSFFIYYNLRLGKDLNDKCFDNSNKQAFEVESNLMNTEKNNKKKIANNENFFSKMNFNKLSHIDNSKISFNNKLPNSYNDHIQNKNPNCNKMEHSVLLNSQNVKIHRDKILIQKNEKTENEIIGYNNNNETNINLINDKINFNTNLNTLNKKEFKQSKLNLSIVPNGDNERNPSNNSNKITKSSDSNSMNNKQFYKKAENSTNFSFFKSKIPKIKKIEKNFSPISIDLSKSRKNNNATDNNFTNENNIQSTYKNDEFITDNKHFSNCTEYNLNEFKSKEKSGNKLKINFCDILARNNLKSKDKESKQIKSCKVEKSLLNSFSKQYTTNVLKIKEKPGFKRNSKLKLASDSHYNINLNSPDSFINNKNQTSKNENLSSFQEFKSNKVDTSQIKLKDFYRLNTENNSCSKMNNSSKVKDSYNENKNINMLDNSFKKSIIHEEKESASIFYNTNEFSKQKKKKIKKKNYNKKIKNINKKKSIINKSLTNKSSLNNQNKKIEINYLINNNKQSRNNIQIKNDGIMSKTKNKTSTELEKFKTKSNYEINSITKSKDKKSFKTETKIPNYNNLRTNLDNNIFKNEQIDIPAQIENEYDIRAIKSQENENLYVKITEASKENLKNKSNNNIEKLKSINKETHNKDSIVETIECDSVTKKSAISILENFDEKFFQRFSDAFRGNDILNNTSKVNSGERLINFEKNLKLNTNTINNNSKLNLVDIQKVMLYNESNNNYISNNILINDTSENKNSFQKKLKLFCFLAEELANISNESKAFVIQIITNLYKSLNNGNSIFSLETNDTKSNNLINLNLNSFSNTKKSNNSNNDFEYEEEVEKLFIKDKYKSTKEKVEEFLINKDDEEISKDILIENMQREILNLKLQMNNYMDFKLDESYMENIANRIIKKIKPESVDIDNSEKNDKFKLNFNLQPQTFIGNKQDIDKKNQIFNSLENKLGANAINDSKINIIDGQLINHNVSNKSKRKNETIQKKIDINKRPHDEKKLKNVNESFNNITQESIENYLDKDKNDKNKFMNIKTTDKDSSTKINLNSAKTLDKNKFYLLGKENLNNKKDIFSNLEAKTKIALRLHKKSYSDLEKFHLNLNNKNFICNSKEFKGLKNSNKKSKLGELREILKKNKLKKENELNILDKPKNSLFVNKNINFKNTNKSSNLNQDSADIEDSEHSLRLIQSRSMISSSRNFDLDFDLENDFCLNEMNLLNADKSNRNSNKFNFDISNNKKLTSSTPQLSSMEKMNKLHLNLNNIQTVSFNQEFFQHETSFSPSWRNACISNQK